MTDRLQLALNAALNQRAIAASRFSALFPQGSSDAKRSCAWKEYGYKDCLLFDDFYKLYAREGVAHGAVNKLVDKCWETDPELIEGEEKDKARKETPWEREFKQLAKRTKLWESVREADKRRLVGEYSALIMQVRDNKSWDQPLARANSAQLVKLIPAWEGQLKVVQWDDNPASETYGDPVAYQYCEPPVDGGASRDVVIHHSRVLILGDLREGESFLQAGYNAFVNLEKIVGGSGESFLKNSSRQLHVGFDKEVDLADIARAYGVEMSELQTIFDDVTRGMNTGQDQTIITQGGTVTPLVATVPDPVPHYSVALQTASASVSIPAKVLVGNQTGERASTEDIKDFNKRAQGRRVNALSADIEMIVERFMQLGILRRVVSTVIWSDLTEQSLEERLANVMKMADVNQKMAGFGDIVFTSAEMREVAGYLPLEQEEGPGEELPDEDEAEV